MSRRCLGALAAAAALTIAGVGCAHATRDRVWLESAVAERTGHRLGPAVSDRAAPLPPGCRPEDGLDADEAVAVALWRSPALQAELTRLDAALADLDEASRPANPRLSFLAPFDPRQLALILALPIDALWQLPSRSEAASRELEAVADALVQVVLDVERSIRLAHLDAFAARARSVVQERVATTWRAAATLARGRASAGDISEAEASAAEAEAVIALDAVTRARADAVIAEARLLAGLGAPWARLPELTLTLAAAELPAEPELIARALRLRPDLRAAALALHASAARAHWERSRALALVATLDGQAARGEWTPHFSPGVQLELPLFARNPGGIGRAEAAVARAGYAYAAQRLTIAAEVVAARVSYERARTSREAYARAVDALHRASVGATSAFQSGDQSYLFAVEAMRREAEARLQQVALDADLARAQAELARSVGGSLSARSGT
ncbi:MAG TPA: TolC family protein [Polyangiaceae bacterium]|nr:TolC family protein [Polyangiaceae bacterium]